MSLKIVFTSDLHIGLITDEIWRTPEITKATLRVVKHCKKLKDEGHEVIFIIGGDVFNTNTSSEKQISAFLTILTKIKNEDIRTIVMVGNHDSISDPNRLSCLSFLKKIKPVYKNITLVEDIKYVKLGDFDTGPCYATFLPHISMALIEKRKTDNSLFEDFDEDDFEGEITPQSYIEAKCQKIMQKVDQGSEHLVFSHLNVIGAHPGSEENLLKKSTTFLPKCFTSDVPIGYIKPTIIQGHIHSSSTLDNVNIIGSPIYCTFGESGKKYFAEITVAKSFGEKHKIERIGSKYIKFKQLELDLTKIKPDINFLDHPKVKNFLSKVKKDWFLKFDVSITPEKNGWYDWKQIKYTIERKYECRVKDITPRILFKRQIRSALQKINLDPDKAVRIYLKRNLRKDTDRMKRIYKKAKGYL